MTGIIGGMEQRGNPIQTTSRLLRFARNDRIFDRNDIQIYLMNQAAALTEQ